MSLRRRVVGSLIGEGKHLAIPDREYPILEWLSSVDHFDVSDSDTRMYPAHQNASLLRGVSGVGLTLPRAAAAGQVPGPMSLDPVMPDR